MPQYIKHYWTDNRGNYQSVANQSVDRRHPNLEGLSVKYWLKDARGVDYCLSVCPDTTIIDAPPVGIEVITKTEWDAIVATIPPPPDPPEIPQPDWETFRSNLATSPEMQAILNEVVKTNSSAVVALTSAAYKLDSGEYYDFKVAWESVMNTAASISEEDPNPPAEPDPMYPGYFVPVFDLEVFKQTVTELATSCNLPGDFITIFD